MGGMLINGRNSSGPKTVPCRTPEIASDHSDFEPFRSLDNLSSDKSMDHGYETPATKTQHELYTGEQLTYLHEYSLKLITI